MSDFPHLFQPIQLGSLRLRNRLMMTTHGRPMQPARYQRYLEERARGGVALIGVLEGQSTFSYPTTVGRFTPSYAGDVDAILPNPATPEGIVYYDRTVVPYLARMAEAVHRHGAVCFGQVHHLGASRTADNMQPPIAPSTVVDEHHRQVPHELGEEEIAELVRAFGHAARRVRDGGMDGVEVHAGHFYLINQFLSPYTNHRTDRYGGSWENRSRFLSEVLDAVRSHAGPGFPIGIRINGEEFVEGGLTLDDMKRVAQDLEGRVAYLSVSGGTYTGLKKGIKMAYVSPWFVPPGPMVPYAAEIKKVVKTPVMVVGRINDPEQAERIIAEGYADMVGMTRALIADPEFPKKARDGRAREIRKCIGTNECHYAGRPIACTINAAAGREEELALHPAPVRRRLLVIGGGPAGMEAARVAALRGHRVVLCERRMRLGGQMAIVARDPNREQVAGFLEYLQRQVEEAGVEVRLGVEVTPEMVAGLAPDAVVVATGSRPYVPPAPGMDQKNVVTAAQVLEGEVKAGRRVLVVGGLEEHMPPLGIAEFLADQGKRVEVLSELLVAGEGLETTLLHLLTKRLLDKGITLTPLTAVEAVRGRTVLAANSFTGQRRTITGVDTVVLACGSRADDTLARALKSRAGELHLIGDCRAPRRMLHAIMEGARAASLV